MRRTEDQLKCERKIHDAIDWANDRYKPRISILYPVIVWDLIGKDAGKAYFTSEHHPARIRLHKGFLHRHPKDYIKRTPVHEAAHIIARHINRPRRIQPHGSEWQGVMVELGLEPKRCHNYDVQGIGRTPSRYLYGCDRCGKEYWLTSIRHRRSLAGEKYCCWCTRQSILEYKTTVDID